MDAVAKAVKQGGVSGDEQAILAQVCQDKQWSGDLRGCLGRATSNEDASSCLKPVMEDVTLANAEAAANAGAKRATLQLQQLQPELEALTNEVNVAVDAVVSSTTDEERTKAQAALTVVRTKKADLEAKISAASAIARTKRVHISRECLDNPLAAGCQ